MRNKLEEIRRLVDELLGELPTEEPSDLPAEDEEFVALQALLRSEDWPEAVSPFHIADEGSESDKRERAEGVADLLLPPVLGKRFLDFGCGEGHLARYVSKDAELSVGYDIRRPEGSPFDWESDQGRMFLTTDFEKVRLMGPYDVVLIYDVLDHAEEETMDQILERASEVLACDGTIHLRCHPWCGRHGGHAYRSLNKAFVHLVFSGEELDSMGVALPPQTKVFYPIDTYSDMISRAGLSMSAEPEIETREVEVFFEEHPLVMGRILRSFGVSEWGESPPRFQMSQCFLDFVLVKS